MYIHASREIIRIDNVDDAKVTEQVMKLIIDQGSFCPHDLSKMLITDLGLICQETHSLSLKLVNTIGPFPCIIGTHQLCSANTL